MKNIIQYTVLSKYSCTHISEQFAYFPAFKLIEQVAWRPGLSHTDGSESVTHCG